MLSHQTAAERHGLIDEPSQMITITVPRVTDPGTSEDPWHLIHRSDAMLRTRHPAMLPPCTRVEDTVLDLIQVAPSFDDAYAWICKAIGRRRTTADRIRQAMDARKKMRWRREVTLALGDAGDGALSVLEYRYVRRVERPHGLPAARRQARIRQRTGNRYLDNLYEPYGVCVELTAPRAPADEQWRDKRRDNANTLQDILTLRFGFRDLDEHRCETRRRCHPAQPPRLAGLAAPCVRPGCALRAGKP